jgi:hypothetical protein
MRVWILEHREALVGGADLRATNFGVYSSLERGLEIVGRHIDVIECDERSWFTLIEQELDGDPIEGADVRGLVCVDREGRVSKTTQPCYPPHLLTDEQSDEGLRVARQICTDCGAEVIGFHGPCMEDLEP